MTGGRGVLRAVVAALLVAVAVAGGWVVWASAKTTPAGGTPLPSATFTAAPSDLARAPQRVTIALPRPTTSRPADPTTDPTAPAADEAPKTSDDSTRTPFVDTGAPDSSTAPLDPAPGGPTSMGPSRVLVPSLGVYGRVVPAGDEGGSMVLPVSTNKVTWYDKSAPLLAEHGTTVLAGHVSYNGIVGAFSPLYRMQAGAAVYVSDAAGVVTAWRVVGLTYHRKGALPPWVFDTTRGRRLALITCGGELLNTPRGRHYADNVVVEAVPAG